MRAILPLIISATLLTALAFFIDWSQFSLFFTRDSLPYCGVAFLFYISCQVLRGLRFTILLRTQGNTGFRYLDGIHLAFIGVFANHVLPMRSGELVFVLVPKIAHKITLDHSTLALLVARVYDLLALAVLSSIALLTLKIKLTLVWYILLLLSTAGIFFLSYRLDILLHIGKLSLQFLFKIARLQNWRLGGRVIRFIDRMLQGFKYLRRPGPFAAIFFCSILIWATLIANFYYLLTSFAPSLTYWEIVIGSLGVHIVQFLPINAVGNFGTYEAGWVAGFVAMGMPVNNAVSSGLACHLIMVAMSALLAAVSLSAIGRHVWQVIKIREER